VIFVLNTCTFCVVVVAVLRLSFKKQEQVELFDQENVLNDVEGSMNLIKVNVNHLLNLDFFGFGQL